MADIENKSVFDPEDWGSPRLPKQTKGGVFAPTDIKLIKEALMFYAQHNGDITDAQERQVVNLLHRINSRT